MEAKPRRPVSLLSTIFHILHVCVLIGLVIAVVRNQLVNESRFEKLEKNDCKCPSKIETKRLVKEKSNVTTTGHPLAVRSLGDNVNHPSHEQDSNSSTEMKDETIQNEEEISASMTGVKSSNSSDKELKANNKTLKKAEATAASTVPTPSKILHSFLEENDAKQSEQNCSLEYKAKLEILGKEARQLFSCLDKLKVIQSQISADNTDSKSRNGCKLLQGLKGDPGKKGASGPKGAMGPKGCSGTSFAYPSFASSPRHLVVNEGKPAVMSCNATANPSAQITWYRDNVMLSGKRYNSSHRYDIKERVVVTDSDSSRTQMCPSEIPHPVTQSTLIIKRSRGSDSGTYICKARNMMGVVSYAKQVLVQVYVQSFTIPSFTTVVEGNDVRLRCHASGVPTPVITWYRKDGDSMPRRYNITGGHLQIYEISKGEEGIFVCLAKNALGSKTTEAVITVNVFPKITSFIEQPITINESQTLVLPCSATGYPKPEIRWSKVNNPLPDGRYLYDSQILKISRVKYEDRGEYVCTANNSAGSLIKKITVTVQVVPKVSRRPNTTEYGYRGKSKTLPLEVFAFPEAKVTWRKPNLEKANQGRFQQMNGSLFIHDLKYFDSGYYQATARNRLGEVKLMTFLVVRDAVPAAIRSVQEQMTISIIEGRNFTKMCRAVGVPTPEIVWTHEGNITISATTLNLPLTIVDVGNQHAGRYTCTARNQFGFEKQHFNMKISQRWVRLEESHSRYYYYGGRPKRGRWSGELMSYQFSSTRSQRYPNNLSQYWKLTSNTRIAIYFKVFSTELCCDKVRIYDGSSTSSPLLGVFSGNVLPPNITSSSKELYIKFTTDDSKPDTGFLAEYRLGNPQPAERSQRLAEQTINAVH